MSKFCRRRQSPRPCGVALWATPGYAVLRRVDSTIRAGAFFLPRAGHWRSHVAAGNGTRFVGYLGRSGCLCSRMEGEGFRIDTPDGEIHVTVIGNRGRQTKVGITAPPWFSIARDELQTQNNHYLKTGGRTL